MRAWQKATTLTAARVTEYIGYLEKGQIPPKVPPFHNLINYICKDVELTCFMADLSVLVQTNCSDVLHITTFGLLTLRCFMTMCRTYLLLISTFLSTLKEASTQ